MNSVSNLPPAAGPGPAKARVASSGQGADATPAGGLAAVFANVLAALQGRVKSPAGNAGEPVAGEALPAELETEAVVQDGVPVPVPEDTQLPEDIELTASQLAAPVLDTPDTLPTAAPSPAALTVGMPNNSGSARGVTAEARTLAAASALAATVTADTPRAEGEPAPVRASTSSTGVSFANAASAVAGEAVPQELLSAVIKPVATPGAAAVEARPEGLPAMARPSAAEWAPIKVDTQHAQWSRDLASALGERLTMQVQQQVKEATVRLDPPDMGRIELVVRMDGDRFSVQLNASHAGVRDMLTQHAERLRNELLGQNLQVLDVQVGQQGKGGGSDRYQAQPDTIASQHAAPESEPGQAPQDAADRWLSTSA